TAALRPALAVGVFGALYGAAAQPLVGTGWTIAMSLLVFSGALQFAVVGLLAAGAGPVAVLLTAATLNVRHLVMGAVLRPHVGGSRWRRAGLAFLLLDETFGFALSHREDAERALLVTGALLHLCWQAGTVLGVLGAGLEGMAGLAEAIFPVLFVGLAAVAIPTRGMLARTVVAAALTGVLLVAWP